MKTIEDRLRKLIEVVTENRHRDQKMFEMTGVSQDKWKNFWFGRKAADATMIESVAKTWPEFAFWLTTGIQDAFNGHRSPDDKEISWDYPIMPRTAARDVFLKEIELANICEKNDWPLDVDPFDFWNYQHGIFTHEDANRLLKIRKQLHALHLIQNDQNSALRDLEHGEKPSNADKKP